MKIVIDTNVIISAIIRDGFSRRIIFDKDIELLTVSFTISEINKHKEEICKKADISEKEFRDLLFIIFKYISIVPIDIYSAYLREAEKLISDIDDAPFLACALYLDCPVWSDDRHFKMQNKIKILTTQDMINIGK